MARTTILGLMLLLGTVFSVAGCAVLTVDVDVYKGPLANDKNVQVEQMAAMAIGAKPLLVELRDMLEATGPWGVSPSDAPRWRRKAKDGSWYRPGYIGPAPGETKSRFENQNADRINQILYLYEDRGDGQYSTIFVRPAKQALKDYETNYDVLRPESLEADKKLWKKVGLKKDNFKDEAKLLLGDGKEQAANELSRDIEELRGDYEKFCTSTGRNARGVFVNWNKLRARLETGQVKLPAWLQNDPLLKGKDRELEASSNAAFRALAETSLVEFQAEHLFGLKGKKKDLFVNHVKKISRAFLEARDALERLWWVEMEAIMWLSNQPADIRLERDRLIYEIAKASLETIQPRHVVELVQLFDADDPQVPDGFMELRAAMGEQLRLGKDWEGRHYKKAKRKLLNAFTKQPGKTAKGLLDCHIFSQSTISASTLTGKGLDPNYHTGHVSGWEFGFARGPFAPPVPTPSALTRGLEGTFPTGAFGKGRLDKGLEMLIEEYLNQANVSDPDEGQRRRARKRLSDALVRFAQKVLFVANNNSLLEDPDKDEPGLIPGLIDATARGLLGWDLRKNSKARQYVRVLQAVGNSILVQVDALCQEKEHGKWLKKRKCEEIAILKRTLSDRCLPLPDMKCVVDNCKGLKDKDRTSKDVRDLWITLLGYEHDLALSKGDRKRADDIKEAIKAAEEKRAGMVYIRPAMAYLRTSFPATSLQDNPNLTWDNMLGGHMMRGMPFGPQLRDFLDPDAKRDAQINAEIDKQFWQNINRVRVAGGGKTNYVIAKDDIGNWYVKGYSADPCDVIKSAKNLAMFSLSAKMKTMPELFDLSKGDKEVSQQADGKKTSLGRMFSKYQKDYKDRTKSDYDMLREVLGEKTLKGRIKKAWDENEALKDCVGALKGELAEASRAYLEPATKELPKSTERKEKETKKEAEKREKEEAERGMKIVNTIQKVRLFHNALVDKIFDSLTGVAARELEKAKDARDKAMDEDKAEEDKNVEAKQEEFEKAEDAARAAQRAVTRIVRDELTGIITSRKDAVEDYETALIFIGSAAKE